MICHTLIERFEIPKILNDIRAFFGKPRKGYYARIRREISMNDKGIFLDHTLVFRKVDIDVYNICNIIDIDELARIERWLSLKYNVTPYITHDSEDKKRQYYTVSYIKITMFFVNSFCHLKIDTSYVDPKPFMFLKTVFVDTL
jgi:hypothetical protein